MNHRIGREGKSEVLGNIPTGTYHLKRIVNCKGHFICTPLTRQMAQV